MSALAVEVGAELAARHEFQRAQLVMERRPQEALGRLREAKRLDPRNVEVAVTLGRLEVRLGRFDEAVDSLQRVLELDAGIGEALGLLALCHLRLGHYEEAQCRSREALKLLPGNRIAREVLADSLAAQGLWQESEQELRALLTETAERQEAFGGAVARLHLKLAHCLLHLGQFRQAWEIANLLKDRGYRDRQVRALIQKCEALNEAEVRGDLGNSTWIQRVLLGLANRQILRAVLMGKRRVTAVGREQVPPLP